MKRKPVLVVMAAGMGSRYGGLKQIDPVGPNGEAILDYSLYDARRAGFETVVLIIKHEIEEDFRRTVGARLAGSGLEVRYAFQQVDMLPQGYTVPEGRTKPWGTAHAILSAAGQIDAPFAVINADDYYGPAAYREIYEYLSAHGRDGADAYSMVGFLLKNTVSEHGSVSRGVCVADGGGCLASVTERTCIEPYDGGIHYSEDGGASWTALPADTVVSMNLFGLPHEFLQELKDGFPVFLDKALRENPTRAEYYLPSAVSALIAQGKANVHILTSADKWYGVTYREDAPIVKEAIRRMTAEGLYPAPLWG